MTEKKKDFIVAIFSGPILAFISFIFLSYYSLYPIGSSESIVFSLGVSIFVLVISHMCFMWLQYNNHVKQTEKIEYIIKNSIHITPVGSVTEAFEYIDSRLDSLIEVRNTSFTTPSSKDNANDKLYKTDTFDKIHKNIPTYASRGLLWKDIGDNKDAINKMEERLYTSNSYNKNHKYSFKKLKNKIPKMNFIIIKYKNNDEEILFNWDLRSKNGDPTVYVSRDKEVINMFSIHYYDLWEFADISHDIKDIK